MKKEKKINIDYLRFFAALMIVAIHIYPLSIISEDLDYLFTRIIFRIAVPFFLMITGYFLLPKAMEDIENLKHYTKKILKIYGISILIYLPINIYNGYFHSFTFFNFMKDILFDGTFYHLWYFPALILGLWFFYFSRKIFKKHTIIVFFLLYLIGIFGDSYYGIIEEIPIIQNLYKNFFQIFDYTRNGIFYTPIFLYIGYCIFEQQKNKKDSYFLIASLFLMIIEGCLLYKFSIPRHNSMYFFLLPTSYFLAKVSLLSDRSSSKEWRNIATWLYILHPMFIVVIRLLAKVVHLENIMVGNSLIFYFLVAISTFLFIVIVLKIIEKIKNS